MNLFQRGAARIVRASVVVDRAQRLFDRVRSTFVARFASDGFLDAYNDLAYRNHADYTVGSARFREGLFHWEEDMARKHLPAPPARLLVGGAGGGREVYAWASQGYSVVAFEPSPTLARAVLAKKAEYPNAQIWRGRYEDLPLLFDVESSASVQIGALGRFDAVVLGWPTYSHIRTRERRVAALRQLDAVTNGPIAISFFLDKHRDARKASRVQTLTRRLGISRPGDAFSPYIGFHHWSTEEELRDEIREAGLEVVDASWDDRDGRWPWIVARRSSAGRAVSS